MNASAAVLQAEALFNKRYRVVRCIKAGGMGAVYEVVDEATSSRRALKVMLPNLLDSDDLRARFALEAKITGSIESDHIVRTSDAGVEPETGMPFLVMELLRGEELGSLLRKRKTLPPEEVGVYLFQAALALDKTHAAGIVHRDLKPDNLFVTLRDDGSPCVKILDFGIAKVLETHASNMTQHMLGTPVYMSPEQIRAERNIGPRADVHALGHVAYTLLVGETYWAEEADSYGSAFMLASEILRGPAEPPVLRAKRRRNRALPDGFDAWFFKATATSPDDRFETASQAVAELASALGVALPRMTRTVLVPESAPPPAPEPSSDATVPSAPRPSGGFAASTTPAVRTPSLSKPVPATPATPASNRTGSATPSRVLTTGSRRDRPVQRRFQVSADPATRILRLKVWGFWDLTEGNAYVDEFRQVAAKLSGRPWYVLADISEFPAQKPEVNVCVEQTMAYAAGHGMRKAANLVSSALTRMQISRLSADTGLPLYSFFTSEAEAVAWLLKEEKG